jgi:phage-related protein
MAIQRYVPETVGDDPSEFLQGYNDNFSELMSFEPSALITLYTLDYSSSTYRFFPGVIEQPKDGKLTGFPFAKELIYDGDKYFPIPCEDEGFEASVGNKFPRPKIRISNIVNKFRDPNVNEAGSGYLSWHRFISTILRSYNELRNAKLKRKRVFVRFLDDENFEDGNPFGVPNPYAFVEDSSWVIYQKTNENKFFVEFELSSVFDIETAYTPARRLSANYCSFNYRGEGCQYAGLPMRDKNNSWFQYYDKIVKAYKDVSLNITSMLQAKEYDRTNKYVIGDVCYVSSEQNYCLTSSSSTPTYVVNGVNKDMTALRTYYVCIQNHSPESPKEPGRYSAYWAVDSCGKQLDDCRLRFGNTANDLYSDIQRNYPLPFGGFPGIDRTRFV